MKKGVWKRAGNHARFLMRIVWFGGRAWAMKEYGIDIGAPPKLGGNWDGPEQVG